MSNFPGHQDSEWVTIAVLGRPRGNKGEVTSSPLTSHHDRFEDLESVRLFGPSGPGAEYEVENTWLHQGTPIFKFSGVDSINAAETLRGLEVRVPKTERVELEEGEFFHDDLIGSEVRDHATGRLVGKVTGWEEFGGPALLEIDSGRVLIPFVKAICVEILPDQHLIRVNLPDGLETVNEESTSSSPA